MGARTVLVLLVAVVAVAAATPSESAQRPPRTVQHALLQEILRGFPGTTVTGRAGAPMRDWARRRHRSFRQSTWLYFEIRPRQSGDQVHQIWQAEVATGLLAGISRSRGWRAVTGETITIVLPDGRRRFDSASVLGTAFRGGIDHVSEQEADRTLREAAAAVGATVESVRFPRPLGRIAVDAVVTTERPASFVGRGSPGRAAFVRAFAGRVEGMHVQIRTGDGRWVASVGGAVRAAASVSSWNPEFG